MGFLGAKLIPNFFILITGERKSINCALLSKKVASYIAWFLHGNQQEPNWTFGHLDGRHGPEILCRLQSDLTPWTFGPRWHLVPSVPGFWSSYVWSGRVDYYSNELWLAKRKQLAILNVTLFANNKSFSTESDSKESSSQRTKYGLQIEPCYCQWSCHRIIRSRLNPGTDGGPPSTPLNLRFSSRHYGLR